MRVSKIAADAVFCAFILMLFAGCPNGGDDDGPPIIKVEETCELGTVDTDGMYSSLAENDSVELVLGFQGFLFIVIAAEVQLSSVETVEALVGIEPEAGDPFGTSQSVTLTTSGTNSIAEDITLFLESSNIAEYTDTNATLSLRLSGETWFCVASMPIHLVDDDPCIHTGEEPICPGDGG